MFAPVREAPLPASGLPHDVCEFQPRGVTHAELSAMRAAFELAENGPVQDANPRVGCVIIAPGGTVLWRSLKRVVPGSALLVRLRLSRLSPVRTRAAHHPAPNRSLMPESLAFCTRSPIPHPPRRAVRGCSVIQGSKRSAGS
jgi:hypothetical protein